MTDTKFTPGPWTVGIPCEWGTANGSKIYDANGESVAEVYGLPINAKLESFCLVPRYAAPLARARLMAAAPDGYALAEEVVNHLYTLQDIARVRQMAKDFLAKAGRA